MPNTDRIVTDHYAVRHPEAAQIIAQARQRAGNPETLTAEHLKWFDEMHVGSFFATRHFIPKLGIAATDCVLDIGSGIGGPARYVAESTGAHVTGLDLTPDYKLIAEELSKAVTLQDRTDFITASATNMPLDNGAFDIAYTMHACMNIAAKDALYSEAARVLKNGGRFGIYDTLRGTNSAESVRYPLPWADDENSSFLLAIEDVLEYLAHAGFTVESTEERAEFAADALRRLQKTMPNETLAPPFDNLLTQIESGALCPWEIIATKTA